MVWLGKTFTDGTKALCDMTATGVQMGTHVGGTIIKITGSWEEVDIKKVNQDAKEVELINLPQSR